MRVLEDTIILVFYLIMRQGGIAVNPIVYALFSYALTAVISFFIVGVIVLVDRMMSHTDKNEKEN